jgi:fimbrial chaperone protein
MFPRHYCRQVCACALFSILIGLPLSGAQALSVTPISGELSDSGPNNKITLRAMNDGAQPVPVEIITTKLTLAEDGTQTAMPVKGKFLIYPPQATIAPAKSQAFHVQWLGDPNLKASETYILNVAQLPIQMDKKKSGIQMISHFTVVVNVSPSNVKPDISVIKTEIANVPPLSRVPVITIANTGNGHALLGEASSISLSNGKWTKTLSKEEILKVFGMGLVQPKSKRRFVMAIPIPPEVSKYDVHIEVGKKAAPARR